MSTSAPDLLWERSDGVAAWTLGTEGPVVVRSPPVEADPAGALTASIAAYVDSGAKILRLTGTARVGEGRGTVILTDVPAELTVTLLAQPAERDQWVEVWQLHTVGWPASAEGHTNAPYVTAMTAAITRIVEAG